MNILTDTQKGDLRVAFINKLSFNEPIGIGYLSAYLKKYFPGIKIELFDPYLDDIAAIRDFKPNFVLYSVMTGQHKENIAINNKLKKVLPPFVSVFGGPHATYFPEVIFADGVDIVCRGEGEIPLKNLLQAHLEGRGISSIKGLWVKNGSDVHKNEVERLVEDLDSFPFPDRDLYYRKLSFLKDYGRKPIVGSRGCPFACSYCYNSGLNKLFREKGKVLRKRSPQSVVDEIIDIRSKYRVNFIAFIEDVFAGVNLEWLKEFHRLYLPIKIPFFISIRAEFINPEVAKYLKQSGCVSASTAIEHGDYEYRKKYMFRKMTNEQIVEGVKILESEGIRVASPIMLGLPFTDIKDDLKSLQLACEAKPSHVTTAVFQPYPGTALTELCLNEGVLTKEDLDNTQEDFYSKNNIRNIDYKQVLKLHNSFSLLVLLNRRFGVDVVKWYGRLPDNFVIKYLNILLKYYTFMKIINYKRSLVEKIKEIYYALATGVFGFQLKRKQKSFSKQVADVS